MRSPVIARNYGDSALNSLDCYSFNEDGQFRELSALSP